VRVATWQLDILVAEDTPSDIKLLEKALERCGEVRSLKIVTDGQDLVDYLRGQSPFHEPGRQVPNLILLDLKMPRMDGFEVLAWLRKHPECSVIPVVVMSTSSLDSDVLQAYRLGANAFFEKPVNFEALQDILRSILMFWSHARRPPLTELCSSGEITVP
jgi:two-component system response regulator